MQFLGNLNRINKYILISYLLCTVKKENIWTHSLVFITKVVYPLVYGRYTTMQKIITAHDKAFSEILSSK